MTRQEAQKQFDLFLRIMRSSMVELVEKRDEFTPDNMFKFEARLKSDRNISEHSMFNLSDEYYNDLEKYGLIYMGDKPSLNNTGSVGWFIIKLEDGK
jgi:RimJ/RimL family protein N-acetyltransferase